MGVFIGSEALAAGKVTRNELRRRYKRICPNVYGPPNPTLRERAEAAWLWSNRRGVIAGVAASALHHARWVADDVPIEMLGRSTRPAAGVIVRNEVYAPDEVMTIHGIPVTTAARTLFDLGRHLPRDEAVMRMDALLWCWQVAVDEVLPLIDRYPSARNIRRLKTALELSDDGAESPRETWLRLALTDAGMRPTRTQIPVFDEKGRIVAKVDMGWEDLKVGVQYDGRQHQTDRQRYIQDLKVNRALEQQKWAMVRVIAEDRLGDTLARVARTLEARRRSAA
ncbi:hypothetical protein [Mycolicibacterium bacteremicum]|uniref:DUF559 domain-containing protein n=1 Tax=Mycolicibacterium bacteremicum TaxID=564198 RepID=A0A1W9Z3D7_MYCBA|nr:hypothetical protein [Mycolicibacterium bacteremicum]MCV7431911.1 hypothetical protein [Mycolicibacterium bacteremicum]ORA06848.1 hypothetical protein BST17_03025 [Mycolicibacterium bacteremicum]